MAEVVRPGSPTAFEALVDDYDAARPTYPSTLYDALPSLAGAEVLELGSGTGLSTAGLVSRVRSMVVTDLGPKMLARNRAKHPSVPGVVCAAEQLPFRDDSFDGVCGAQMWHWTSPPAAEEVARVLRPGGWLALWWNEVRVSAPWWDAQQDRLEAGNPRYRRGYREVDYAAELAPLFTCPDPVEIPWSRTLDLDLYERWLRSKSYVQELPDVDAFVVACRADLLEAFPDGRVVEPFVTRLWLFTTL